VHLHQTEILKEDKEVQLEEQFLMSPAMVAVSAIEGKIVDVRNYL